MLKNRSNKMKKMAVLIGLVLLLAFAVLPAGAMIGGELDTEHTNVGAIVFEWPAYDDILARICTATLIHPQALLSAAHCTVPLFKNDLVPEKVWITFEAEALMGTPVTHPDQYLEIDAIINHPNYEVGEASHDIALVILAESVDGIDPVDLPAEVYMDEILQTLPRGKAQRDLDLIFIGYGATGNWGLPDIHLDAVRRVGTVSFVNLRPLEILTNNSSPKDAVICDGDSGGPIFYVVAPKTEVFVGIHSGSGTPQISCDGLGLEYKTRVDTASTQEFINDTIAAYLPPPD